MRSEGTAGWRNRGLAEVPLDKVPHSFEMEPSQRHNKIESQFKTFILRNVPSTFIVLLVAYAV